MRRAASIGLTAVIAVATLVAGAVPAFAHEEINPSTVQTGKPTFFSLTAANEKDADLTKLVLTAPAGTSLGESTRSPAGWTASRTAQAITWTGGKVSPGTFEQWGFEIDGADQPGTLTFKVSLTAGGDTEDANVPVTVVAGSGTAVPPATSTPTVTASPVTTTPTTAAPASGGASGAAVAAATKKADDASNQSSTATTLAALAIGLGVIGIILAVAALARRRTSSPAGSAGAGRPDGTPQDF